MASLGISGALSGIAASLSGCGGGGDGGSTPGPYQITRLEPFFGDWYGEPYFVSDAGEVVGSAQEDNFPNSAFYWKPGMARVAQTHEFAGSYIGNSERVGISSLTVGPSGRLPGHVNYAPTLLVPVPGAAPGTFTQVTLPFPPGAQTPGSAMAEGQPGSFFGYVASHVDYLPARWTQGFNSAAGTLVFVPTLLPLPSGLSGGIVYDANASNHAVGGGNAPNAEVGQAVYWTPDGTATALGLLPGTTSSMAFGINASGTVIGACTLSVAVRPFQWTPSGGMQELLPLPGDDRAEVHGINDAGDVIGTSRKGQDYSSNAHLTLWRNGVAIDLRDGIGEGWRGTEGLSINNHGQLLVIASKNDRYEYLLLTPR